MPDYEILTNSYGRRVLKVNRYFKLRTCESVGVDDFDIVFFDTADNTYNDLRHMLSAFSPIRSLKYQLKPKYMTSARSRSQLMLERLLDGFSPSALDPDMTERAEQVLRQIDALGIKPMTGHINTRTDYFMRLCQCAVSRQQYTFTSSSLPPFRKGLSNIYSGRLDLHDALALGESPNDRELRAFVDYLVANELVTPDRFVERIHLCPDCQDEELLFIETCSKCSSSHIDHEDMIHHFRCANIAPESEYTFDGELRCPKCRRFLRHIGIDYERPAQVALCRKCGLTQLSTVMRARCMACGSVHAPQDLIPYDIMEYSFTPAGIRAVAEYTI